MVVAIVGLVLSVTVGGVSASAVSVDPAVAENAVTDPVPLLELRTNGDAGWFWTLSEAEAARAVGQDKMTLLASKLGYLRRQPFPGGQPIYRLVSSSTATYLLTASASERDALTGGAQPAFRYEGVLGYAFASRAPGTAPLWRMHANTGTGWRVVPDADVAGMRAQGYTVDGPLGFVYATYDRVGATYFGTFDGDGNQHLMTLAQAYYGRTEDWWAGVKDFAGADVAKNTWGHWPNTDFGDLKPSIGYYDDSQPATLQRQIAQASAAGLRYFTFYWYWNPANGGGEQLIDGLTSFLRANNRGSMEFTVMPCIEPWSNGDVSLRLPADQITKAADTIVDSYLGQPNYLRANDGRPIVEVCDDRGIGAGSTSTVDTVATQQFIDAIRARARANYGEEVLITENDQLPVTAGFDGTQVQGRYDASRSYATYVANERGRLANFPGVLIRGATSGFDNRPWDKIGITDTLGPDATQQQLAGIFDWYDDHSISAFGTLLGNLQADIDASTRPPAADNLVLIYAWNEWHEGGHIEPNVRDRCGYLDTIQARLRLPGAGCSAVLAQLPPGQ